MSRISISLSFENVPFAVEPKTTAIKGLTLRLSKNSLIALFLSEGRLLNFL